MSVASMRIHRSNRDSRARLPPNSASTALDSPATRETCRNRPRFPLRYEFRATNYAGPVMGAGRERADRDYLCLRRLPSAVVSIASHNSRFPAVGRPCARLVTNDQSYVRPKPKGAACICSELITRSPRPSLDRCVNSVFAPAVVRQTRPSAARANSITMAACGPDSWTNSPTTYSPRRARCRGSPGVRDRATKVRRRATTLPLPPWDRAKGCYLYRALFSANRRYKLSLKR